MSKKTDRQLAATAKLSSDLAAAVREALASGLSGQQVDVIVTAFATLAANDKED